MKKVLLTICTVGIIGFFMPVVSAQMMGGLSTTAVDWDAVVEHTLREEQEGKELWDRLQAKEIVCADLDDEQFGVLGEHFMGQMAGASHAAMNAMMMQMHGEDGEEQIHTVMGKRLSGCDTSASFPAGGGGWMSIMGMMMGGGWSSPLGNTETNTMMNFGFGSFGGFGWIFMILWWALIIAGLVALMRLFTNHSCGTHGREKSTLDILKDRYARGEIDKNEFEEKRKDLGL